MIVLETNLPRLHLLQRGKVRDIYGFGDELLIVATDRISAFDYVLSNGIPGKGHVLTALSAFWFEWTKHIVPNHLISTDINVFPLEAQGEHRNVLADRSMFVRKAERVDIECVVRGYLAGSGWKEYRESGTVCGEPLPKGLRESEKLPFPIFTPATKANSGHDENISVVKMADLIGAELTEDLKRISIALYEAAANHALTRGIIIADTKFEFGIRDGEIILIDEALTPDSSRFWPMSDYEPGRGQKSFDKQYVRDYLESIGWEKQPPVPQLPAEVVEATSAKYDEARRRLIPFVSPFL